MKNPLFYLLYLIFCVALIILTLEGAGRILIHFKYGISGKSYGLWKYDPDLGSTHRNHAYNTHTSTNDQGFRNLENVFDPKPSSGIRVIAFGGSTTYGYNLGDKETFTYQLQRELRRYPEHSKSQVLNSGRIAVGASYNFVLMKKIVPKLKPDYVIIYEGINETMASWGLMSEGVLLDDLDSEYGRFSKSGKDSDRWLKRNSILVRLIDYRLKGLIKKGRKEKGEETSAPKIEEPKPHPWVIKNYEWVLPEIIRFLRAQNVIPIVIQYASVYSENQKFFSELSGEIARSEGALVYNMQKDFAAQPGEMSKLFIYTGVHVEPEGAKIMARGLAGIILSDLKEKRL